MDHSMVLRVSERKFLITTLFTFNESSRGPRPKFSSSPRCKRLEPVRCGAYRCCRISAEVATATLGRT